MAKLSTQPQPAKAQALRSGFFSLPFAHGLNLFARLHAGASHDEPSTSAAVNSHALFLTSLPLGVSVKAVTKLMTAVYPNLTVESVELLEPLSGRSSLLDRELVTASIESDVLPLFDDKLAGKASFKGAVRSCIVHFDGVPSLPPPAYSPSVGLALPSAPSATAIALARHSLARPHPSTIIAHTDSWMQAFDARKLAHQASLQPTPLAVLSKTQAKKVAKSKAAEPLPGSAAHALAQHAAQRALEKDHSHNPDQIDEDGWTLVTAGGKHGRSVLPEGTVASVSGYGGKSVKIAGKKGRGANADAEAGVKSIVGEGFYRFKKEEGRRTALLKMASEFENDREKARRFRELAESGGGAYERRLGGGGRGRGRGGSSSRGRGAPRGGRGGRGASRGGGKEGRSFKPY